MSLVARLAFPGLLLLSFLTLPAATVTSGDTERSARGIVTAIGADSIMINLPSDTDVTFRVDATTQVVAHGAGTKMRRAQAQGAPGLKLSDVVPIGGTVVVSYEEREGRRCARRITSIAPSRAR